jgi:hypothetical protein
MAMSDWQVGDLALCVGTTPAGRWMGQATGVTIDGPTSGQVLRVVKITHGGDGLRFAEFDRSFHRDRFRKILPDAHEACEEEFVTLLRRTKRKVGA